MADNKTLQQLEYFRLKRKFLVSEFDEESDPSIQKLNDGIESRLNTCIDSLIIIAKNNSNKLAIKNVLKSNLKTFRKLDYSTEEKEVIAERFDDLSAILKINIAVWINGKSIITPVNRDLKYFVTLIISRFCKRVMGKFSIPSRIRVTPGSNGLLMTIKVF